MRTISERTDLPTDAGGATTLHEQLAVLYGIALFLIASRLTQVFLNLLSALRSARSSPFYRSAAERGVDSRLGATNVISIATATGWQRHVERGEKGSSS